MYIVNSQSYRIVQGAMIVIAPVSDAIQNGVFGLANLNSC